MKDGVYKNICPRNCYSSCGILSHVKNNTLVKVAGDPNHGFNRGKLCAKGYAYTEFVYHPERLKYPMVQYPRHSGNWQRISWDEAYDIIAKKIIELHERYGSNLAATYNKFSGNLGILHYATEGMFNSIGPHTKPVGNPCAFTGRSAINDAFNKDFHSIPENMENSKLIVLWGANPAVTNIHQMKFIYHAQRKGAKLVVIDPIYTKTAKKADFFIQINPSTDMWLAFGIAKMIVEKKHFNNEFLRYTSGWEKFKHFLLNELTYDFVIEKTGVPLDAIKMLALYYGTIKPVSTWIGLGIQRSKYGRDGIKSIINLVTITGNLTAKNSGLYYMNFDVEDFPLKLLNHRGPSHNSIKDSRKIDITDFAREALKLKDPPIKFLWIASRNIFSQDHNMNDWKMLIDQLELIVTVDLFLTKTAKISDIVLPAASHFEEEDLNVSYWHRWLSINQKAIPQFYEAKSDLQIARELTKKLNELSPGFSNFPYEKEPLDWIKEELTEDILLKYGITDVNELFNDYFHKEIDDEKIPEKIYFFYPKDTNQEGPQIWMKKTENDVVTNIRLITPQSLLNIHSQFDKISWLQNKEEKNYAEISKEIADLLNIRNDSKIIVFNDNGAIVRNVKINKRLPENVIVASQGGEKPINALIKDSVSKNDDSNYFYDSFVNIKKWSEHDV